jgi:hypothetical protein
MGKGMREFKDSVTGKDDDTPAELTATPAETPVAPAAPVAPPVEQPVAPAAPAPTPVERDQTT